MDRNRVGRTAGGRSSLAPTPLQPSHPQARKTDGILPRSGIVQARRGCVRSTRCGGPGGAFEMGAGSEWTGDQRHCRGCPRRRCR